MNEQIKTTGLGGAPLSETIATLNQRVSVRSYADKPVDDLRHDARHRPEDLLLSTAQRLLIRDLDDIAGRLGGGGLAAETGKVKRFG